MMGRIVQVHPGADGLVRIVTVDSSQSIFNLQDMSAICSNTGSPRQRFVVGCVMADSKLRRLFVTTNEAGGIGFLPPRTESRDREHEMEPDKNIAVLRSVFQRLAIGIEKNKNWKINMFGDKR